MNTYIQNKLDEFENWSKKTLSHFESDDCGDEYNVYIHSTEGYEKIEQFIEQSLTDYHNHIVEKIKLDKPNEDASYAYKLGYNDSNQSILSLLQDTNPKE